MVASVASILSDFSPLCLKVCPSCASGLCCSMVDVEFSLLSDESRARASRDRDGADNLPDYSGLSSEVQEGQDISWIHCAE